MNGKARPLPAAPSVVSPGRARLLLAAVAACAASLASTALVGAAVWLVVTAAGRPSIAALSVAIVTVRALAVGAGLLRYLERLVGHDAVLAGLTERRAGVVTALVPRTDRLSRGRWVHRLVSDVDATGDLLVRGALPGVATAVTGLLAVVCTALVAPAASAALATGLLAVACLVPIAVRRACRTARDAAGAAESLSAAAVEIARAGADLAVFGGLDRAEQDARALAERVAAVERGGARAQAGLRALAGLVVAAVVALTVVAAAPLTPAWAALVPVLAATVLTEALALLVAAPRLAHAAAARRRTAEPAHTALPVAVPDRPRPCPDDGVPHLRLRDPALDLDVPPGARVLLTGPSGAGKSTLLSALWRVVEPRGRYTLDGVDAGELDPDAVRERVGGLWQDAYLPRSTLRDALRIARPTASDDELRSALTTAGIDEDVLPAGLDGVVAEGGENLSGGQRRRLLVARTLLADRPVLLFDEPAEGLDTRDADRLLTALLTLAPPGRSVVVVSHRVPDALPRGTRTEHVVRNAARPTGE